MAMCTQTKRHKDLHATILDRWADAHMRSLHIPTGQELGLDLSDVRELCRVLRDCHDSMINTTWSSIFMVFDEPLGRAYGHIYTTPAYHLIPSNHTI
ncbi:hypothetical protein FocTR4_00006498 [Fusarium oxysporum f. sp. cubense]|uniref:Uncharacterized protein n=1 Tax=Fusarium oxysporum f. sp. cubense TaxID=61366 RepID=A0A5C6TND8_FUSOC|nr:hypothetical protein FocTR4_00006498 [Fusarium oxysporum f. sp. cubense]